MKTVNADLNLFDVIGIISLCGMYWSNHVIVAFVVFLVAMALTVLTRAGNK